MGRRTGTSVGEHVGSPGPADTPGGMENAAAALESTAAVQVQQLPQHLETPLVILRPRKTKTCPHETVPTRSMAA